MDLAQINRDEYRLRHLLAIGVVGNNPPPGRQHHTFDGAILGGVIRALSPAQNIDRVQMPSEKSVLPEVGVLRRRGQAVSSMSKLRGASVLVAQALLPVRFSRL